MTQSQEMLLPLMKRSWTLRGSFTNKCWHGSYFKSPLPSKFSFLFAWWNSALFEEIGNWIIIFWIVDLLCWSHWLWGGGKFPWPRNTSPLLWTKLAAERTKHSHDGLQSEAELLSRRVNGGLETLVSPELKNFDHAPHSQFWWISFYSFINSSWLL